MFHRVRDIIRMEGFAGLAHRSIAYVYRRGLRPWIPGTPVRYAGIVTCHDTKWGDRLVPALWVPDAASGDRPRYEAALIEGLNEAVRQGDDVVVVGAGFGVTAVVAALRSGASGTVQCFEGSKEQVRCARQTASRNGLTNIVVHHAVVAKPINVYGGGEIGDVLPPSQLPSCDILQMDCEGAELEILREMTIQPRNILVETHGVFGASTDLVASLLKERGYFVTDRGFAEPHLADQCEKNDIRVLLGTIRNQ